MAERANKDIALNYMTPHEYEVLTDPKHPTELPVLKVRPTPNLLQFNDPDGNEIGRLFFKDGELDFEGNATQSALALFEAFKTHIEQQLTEVKDAKK